GGVLFLALPKTQVSMDEKRKLAPVPTFTWVAALTGQLSKSIDDYYSDHFEFRETFLAWADQVKTWRGIGADADVQVFDTAKNTPSGQPANNARDYANIHSVVVYHGRAVQIAMGSYLTAARFAGVVNAYHRALGPGVTVYCMAIPVGSDFYLPHAIDHGQMRERDNIKMLYADLAP